jgi:hypothetical protein
MRRWHARESAAAHKPQSQPAERSGPVERLRCNEGGAAQPRYPHAQCSISHANWYASLPESWLGVTSHPCPVHYPLH